MTIDEFKATRFGVSSKVCYKGKQYKVYSVDFEECLIAIDEHNTDGEWWQWKRCENCEMV